MPQGPGTYGNQVGRPPNPLKKKRRPIREIGQAALKTKKTLGLMNIEDRIVELDAQIDDALEFAYNPGFGDYSKLKSPPKLSRKEKLIQAYEQALAKTKKAGKTARVMGKRRGQQAVRATKRGGRAAYAHIGRHPGKYAAGLGGLGAAALLLRGRGKKDD